MIGIYKITSPSGKHYIGQSVDINRRKKEYQNLINCNKQHRLYNSLKKYGFNLHEFIILETLDKELKGKNLADWLNDREIYYSLKYNTLSPSGLNLKIGGGNGFFSDEVKRKFSESRKGEKHYMFGKHYSEEVKQKMRESQLGEKSKMFGKPKSIETRKRMSESRIGTHLSEGQKQKLSNIRKGKKFEEIFGIEKATSMLKNMSKAKKGISFTEEHKIKIANALRGEKSYMYGKKHSLITRLKMIKSRTGKQTKKAKAVDQYSLDGEFIRTHRSIRDAEKSVNAHCSDVGCCLRGYQKTAKGYIWKYHNIKQLI